jgi:hypothetical protein
MKLNLVHLPGISILAQFVLKLMRFYMKSLFMVFILGEQQMAQPHNFGVEMQQMVQVGVILLNRHLRLVYALLEKKAIPI